MSSDTLCQPLARLHTRIADVISGYETLEKRAAPGMAGTARRMLALHRRHRGALAGMLRAMGCEAAPSGSFRSVIQSGVIVMRDWAGELDDRILLRVIEGEEALLGLYDEALETAAHRSAERMALLEQRRGLVVAVEGLEARAAA